MQDPILTPVDYQTPPDPRDRPGWFRRNIKSWEKGDCLLVSFGALAVLWANRLPACDITLAAPGFLCIFVGGAVWLINLGRPQGEPSRRQIRLMIAAPLTVILMSALLATDMPRRLMFHTNKPALDRWAKRWMASPNPPVSGRSGIYDLYDTAPFAGGFRAYVRGAQGLMAEGGLVYSPSTRPDDGGAETYAAISGGWYYLYNDN